MGHRLLVLAVVGFWAAMTASLVRKWLVEVRPETLPGTYRSVLTPERQNYQSRMGIFYRSPTGPRRVGYTETVFLYDQDGRSTITNTTRILKPVGRPLHRLLTFDLYTTVVVSQQRALKQLRVVLDSPVGRATCWGEVVAGHLVLHVNAWGKVATYELPLPAGGMVGTGLSPLVALPPLRAGLRWRVAVLNPLSLAPAEAELEVLRRERITWRGKEVDTHVVEIRTGPLTTHAWVSPDGEVLVEKTPFNLVLIKEPVPEVED